MTNMKAECSGHDSSYRISKILTGHTGAVESVAVTPDGKSLISAGQDGTVRLWDMESGIEIGKMTNPVPIDALAIRKNGKHFLLGGDDEYFGECDVAALHHNTAVATMRRYVFRGMRSNFLREQEYISANIAGVAYSPNGNLIGACGTNSKFIVWNRQTGRRVCRGVCSKEIGNPDSGLFKTIGIAFSPDSAKILLTAGKSVWLFDISSGKFLREYTGLQNWSQSGCFSPNGNEILASDENGGVFLWETRTGQLLQQFEEHSDAVHSVVFSPDGTKILSGSYDTTAILWGVNSGRILSRLQGHSDVVHSVGFFPDSNRLFTGSYDHSIRIWEPQTETSRIGSQPVSIHTNGQQDCSEKTIVNTTHSLTSLDRDDPHVKDVFGRTALHHAVANPNTTLETVKNLLKYGADVNVQDHHGDTPLHFAALYHPQIEVYSFLLEHGGDEEIENEDCKTPADRLVFRRFCGIIEFNPKDGKTACAKERGVVTMQMLKEVMADRKDQSEPTDKTPTEVLVDLLVAAKNKFLGSAQPDNVDSPMSTTDGNIISQDKIPRQTSLLQTYFLLGRRNFHRFQRYEDMGCVEIFYPDKAVWNEAGTGHPVDREEPIIDCRSMPHNNHWSFLVELAEFVKLYQSNGSRCVSQAENVWIQVDFHDLEHDGNGTFTCTETTRIVLNPFIAPRITALKSTPNRPLQAFLDFHGGKSYDQKSQTNFTKGSLFHEKVEHHVAGTGKGHTEVNREFILSEPWSALASDYTAFVESDALYREFLRQAAADSYRQSYHDGRLDVEIDFLNAERGLLGKEDFVQNDTDGTSVAQVIDLKSGNAYHADRQQIYLYLDANNDDGQNTAPDGKIHYRDKDEGFCEVRLRPSDITTTNKWGDTIRGCCDYDFYRNNWVLQFLYASFVPEFYAKTGDADHVDLSPKKPSASCEKWTRETCEMIVPQYGILSSSSSPCDRFCKGSAAKRTFHLTATADVRHLYFKWMVSMIHKQAMLEYLEFQYFCNRPLKSLKESCRVVVNAIFEDIKDGIVCFCVPKDDDHSDFCSGTGIIVVPYEIKPSPFSPNDRREDIGRPIRENSGKIRFLRGTVTRIDASEKEFKRFWISISNPFPERFLKRYGTFSFQESSFDSSATESQVLFQTVLGDSNRKLRRLLLNESSLAASNVDPTVRKTLDWINEQRNKGLLTGGRIDENKIKIVAEAISADTLYMIQGPPGTGKTFSIVLIALYYLIFTKKNVKIATFTNNAAKRILHELGSEQTMNFCYGILENLEKSGNGIHPEGFDPFAEGAIKWAGKQEQGSDGTRIDDMFLLDSESLATAVEHGERAFQQSRDDIKKRIRILVGTTHSLFSNSLAMYDWKAEDTITIIDEASQLTEPKTLLGLTNSGKYILVGDEKQLSPVVPNREEIPLFPNQDKSAPEDEAGKNSTSLDTRVPDDPFWEPLRKIELKNFNESLFERFLRLYAQVPGHHGQLEVIYRGPIELYEFSNREYYNGTLKSERKAAKLVSQVDDPIGSDCEGAVFFDVPLDSPKPRSSKRHAEYIRDHILAKIKEDDWEKLSIVTLFNAQVHELRQIMPEIDVRTVDRMQGHENDVIVFDIACSTKLLQNAKGLALLDGKLVAKKLNVALTRAKKKLIVVGDRKALEADKDEFEGTVDECGSFKKMMMFFDQNRR